MPSCAMDNTWYSISLRDGIAPLALGGMNLPNTNADADEAQVSELLTRASFRSRLHEIMMRATAALSKEMEHTSNRQSNTIVSLISYFDSELLEISPRAPTDIGNGGLRDETPRKTSLLISVRQTVSARLPLAYLGI